MSSVSKAEKYFLNKVKGKGNDITGRENSKFENGKAEKDIFRELHKDLYSIGVECSRKGQQGLRVRLESDFQGCEGLFFFENKDKMVFLFSL